MGTLIHGWKIWQYLSKTLDFACLLRRNSTFINSAKEKMMDMHKDACQSRVVNSKKIRSQSDNYT